MSTCCTCVLVELARQAAADLGAAGDVSSLRRVLCRASSASSGRSSYGLSLHANEGVKPTATGSACADVGPRLHRSMQISLSRESHLRLDMLRWSLSSEYVACVDLQV
jgi:hypothetical protein